MSNKETQKTVRNTVFVTIGIIVALVVLVLFFLGLVIMGGWVNAIMMYLPLLIFVLVFHFTKQKLVASILLTVLGWFVLELVFVNIVRPLFAT